jgi:hypothetical protein
MGQQSMTIDKEQHQQEAGKKEAIALTNRMGKRKPSGVVCWCADGPSVLLSFDMYRCAAPSLRVHFFSSSSFAT